MFESHIYSQRRNVLKEHVASGLILFPGNDQSPMNYRDNVYPFVQDSSFLYYWGLDTPTLAAIMDLDEGKEIIFGTDSTLEEAIWTGPQSSLASQAERCGVHATVSLAELKLIIGKALKERRTIHILPQYRPENIVNMHELLGQPIETINNHYSVEFVRAVVDQRSIKSMEEIEQIEAALEITNQMHLLAMKMTKPGIVEQEIAGAMEGKVYSLGGRLAFPVIFSVRGEVLHNIRYDNVMQDGDLALNDSAATSPLHYASDITRTFPVNGIFSPQQKEIYRIVLDMQHSVLNEIRPGVKYRDLHLLSAKVCVEGLKSIGLMKGDDDEIVQAGAHALFYPHGLGHMLGLDVHDMESLGEDYVGYDKEVQRSGQFGLAALRLGRALAERFVITVEPGIYFIPALIDQWRSENKFDNYINYSALDAYRDFGGIRIEDNILVTSAGHRNLSEKIPKSPADVETCVLGNN